MNVNNSGLIEYRKKLEQLRDKGTHEIIKNATNEIAQRIYAITVENTPVNSGFLRNGWDIETEEDAVRYKVTIFNNVEYAIYVEYGHRVANSDSWVKGKFMFTVAKKQIMENDFERIVEKHFKIGLEGLK